MGNGWNEGQKRWTGGLGVGMSWAGLIVYNFAVAMEPMQRMIETVGGILGGMPGPVTVLITLCIAFLLGTVGGGLGTQIRYIFGPG